ncbi:MAG: hypothetical protein ABIP51_22565 [Bacteroidia bacterium]
MTAICALCKSLLKGEVQSIMTGFKWFGISNVPREIGRGIERKFGVKVSRTSKDFTSRYGQSGNYFEYRLNFTEYNREGIERMRKYVEETERKPLSKQVKKGPKIVAIKSNTVSSVVCNTLLNQSSLFD